jgi:hypothetical protein
MASIQAYRGTVIFSAGQLRAHFANSDELVIEDGAHLILGDIESLEETLSPRDISELSDEQAQQEIANAIKRVIDRILLPLGKVLKGVLSGGSITIHGIEKTPGRFHLFSSDKDIKLTVHAGDVITKTGYLIGALRGKNSIVLKPNQRLVLADVNGDEVIARTPAHSKRLSILTEATRNTGLKIEGTNLTIAKDVTTGGLGIWSPDSDLVLSIPPKKTDEELKS